VKIIFLIDANFSNREYERFGFFEILNEKIELQIFDFRKLKLGGGIQKKVLREMDMMTGLKEST